MQCIRHAEPVSLQPLIGNSRGTQVAIGSLSASATVLTPSSDETIIDQTPTPSRQAHRGVGGRCARNNQGPAAGGSNGFSTLQKENAGKLIGQ